MVLTPFTTIKKRVTSNKLESDSQLSHGFLDSTWLISVPHNWLFKFKTHQKFKKRRKRWGFMSEVWFKNNLQTNESSRWEWAQTRDVIQAMVRSNIWYAVTPASSDDHVEGYLCPWRSWGQILQHRNRLKAIDWLFLQLMHYFSKMYKYLHISFFFWAYNSSWSSSRISGNCTSGERQCEAHWPITLAAADWHTDTIFMR